MEINKKTPLILCYASQLSQTLLWPLPPTDTSPLLKFSQHFGASQKTIRAVSFLSVGNQACLATHPRGTEAAAPAVRVYITPATPKARAEPQIWAPHGIMGWPQHSAMGTWGLRSQPHHAAHSHWLRLRFSTPKKQNLWSSLAILQSNVFTEVAQNKRGKRGRNPLFHSWLHSRNQLHTPQTPIWSLFISEYYSNQEIYHWACRHSYTRIPDQCNPPSRERNPECVA